MHEQTRQGNKISVLGWAGEGESMGEARGTEESGRGQELELRGIELTQVNLVVELRPILLVATALEDVSLESLALAGAGRMPR